MHEPSGFSAKLANSELWSRVGSNPQHSAILEYECVVITTAPSRHINYILKFFDEELAFTEWLTDKRC